MLPVIISDVEMQKTSITWISCHALFGRTLEIQLSRGGWIQLPMFYHTIYLYLSQARSCIFIVICPGFCLFVFNDFILEVNVRFCLY
jgi:hypothetical protein